MSTMTEITLYKIYPQPICPFKFEIAKVRLLLIKGVIVSSAKVQEVERENASQDKMLKTDVDTLKVNRWADFAKFEEVIVVFEKMS